MAKRVSLSEKKRAKSNDLDSLFANDYINSEDGNKTESKPVEIQLKKVDEIKAYYDEYVGGKQVSIYLPDEIHALVKAKASQEGRSMKDAIKRVVINDLLTDEEIKSAYAKRFSKD